MTVRPSGTARRARRLRAAGAAALLGAACARGAYATLLGPRRRDRVDGDVFRTAEHSRDVWQRTNFRGEQVTLVEGPAVTAGICAGVALAPGVPERWRAAALVAVAGAGAFGAYDDLSGTAGARGFRGHLAALRRGTVTTGAVKIAGIGASGVAAAALAGRRPLDALLDGALIAGAANLMNLFDLRPGRAAKVALAAGAPALAGPAPGIAGAALGAAAALLPEDLDERAMLGDAGANALGAALGTAAAASLPRRARLGVLGAVAGLTLASEFVSFGRVIAATPPLRRLDELGRRRDAAPAPGPVPAHAPMPQPPPARVVVPAQAGPPARDRT
ncbi:hypothetical protein [Nocardiopsis trehalosi]|uniref:hypothetical protein n=1 Tax=Nocardiopsis trehalosi TaxID=109329 RepID=UPI00082B1531|nr:hypothetical protein [Nocardiopsis trehalosi]